MREIIPAFAHTLRAVVFVCLMPCTTALGSSTCVGDCNGDGEVTVDELLIGIGIALESAQLATCPAFDSNADHAVTIADLVAAVNDAMRGCTAVSPTVSATAVSTATPTAAPGISLIYTETHQEGVNGISGLNGAASVAVSADGANTYVGSAQDAGAVVTFVRARETGRLTYVRTDDDESTGLRGLWGVVQVVVSPDGESVYAATCGGSTVLGFKRDATTGQLAAFQAEPMSGACARSAVVTPDGRHLYVGYDLFRVGVFGLDRASGSNQFLTEETLGQNETPAAMAITPDGKNLFVMITPYVTGTGRSLAFFLRDPLTGHLTDAGPPQRDSGFALRRPVGLTVTPDGTFVYVAHNFPPAVTTFRTEPESGALVFATSQTVDDVDNVTAIATAPSGNYLLVLGAQSGAGRVIAFERDFSSGELRFVQVLRDEDEDVGARLGRPSALAVSPDSRDAYITSGTGRLSVLRVHER